MIKKTKLGDHRDELKQELCSLLDAIPDDHTITLELRRDEFELPVDPDVNIQCYDVSKYILISGRIDPP